MKVTQYQTSINLDFSKLSKEQIKIRAKSIYEQGEKKRCKKCLKIKLFKEFRLRSSRRGVKGIFYDASCKDCHARTRGTNEIGKLKFAKEIFKKGFRRCGKCKDIKPLIEFYMNKAQHSGINHTCKKCNYTKILNQNKNERTTK